MSAEHSTWEEAVVWLRTQPDQADLVRACYYDDPLLASAERYYKSTEWAAVRKLLPGRHGKALDLGAGRGISSYALAKDGWEVTALEPDPSDVVGANAIQQLITETDFNITVVKEFGENLPFEPETFDLVFGRAVLHHANSLKKICREISRVLMPCGRMIMIREHVISRKKDLHTFLENHPLHALYGGENAFMLNEYIEAIVQSEMRISQTFAPYDSEINLYPGSLQSVRNKFNKKFFYMLPDWFFTAAVIPLLNTIDNTPGRLYSFLAEKPA